VSYFVNTVFLLNIFINIQIFIIYNLYTPLLNLNKLGYYLNK